MLGYENIFYIMYGTPFIIKSPGLNSLGVGLPKSQAYRFDSYITVSYLLPVNTGN